MEINERLCTCSFEKLFELTTLLRVLSDHYGTQTPAEALNRFLSHFGE